MVGIAIGLEDTVTDAVGITADLVHGVVTHTAIAIGAVMAVVAMFIHTVRVAITAVGNGTI